MERSVKKIIIINYFTLQNYASHFNMVKKIPSDGFWRWQVKDFLRNILRNNFERKFMVFEFLISGYDWFLLKQTDFPTQWTFWMATMMDFRWINLFWILKSDWTMENLKIKTHDLTVRMYKSLFYRPMNLVGYQVMMGFEIDVSRMAECET